MRTRSGPELPAADGFTGGIENTELLTLELVGRVPHVTRRGRAVPGDVGVMNWNVMEWETLEGNKLPGAEVTELAKVFTRATVGGSQTAVTERTVERWFDIPDQFGRTGAANCVPLEVIGRKARGFLPRAPARRVNNLDQQQRRRVLLAACLCSADQEDALDEAEVSGGGYPVRVRGDGRFIGGLYRSEPIFTKRDGYGNSVVYEEEPHYCSTLAEAVQYLETLYDPDGGIVIETGHRAAFAWVRLWIQQAGSDQEGGTIGWWVRMHYTYPNQGDDYDDGYIDPDEDPEADPDA